MGSSGDSLVTQGAQGQKRTTKRLAKKDVKYLVLEGGGGKGFAYLGAVGILEELDILKQVVGFAGSSAGAITALLLSIGYTTKRLTDYMLDTDFTRFYDSVEPRTQPIVGGYKLVEPPLTALEKEFLELLPASDEYFTLAGLTQSGLGIIMSHLLASNKNKAPISLLRARWQKYVTYIGRDMGLFSGEAARKEFDRLLSKEFRSYPPVCRNLTFKEHYDRFQKDLLITGSNLSIGKTVLFSHEETPNFPVADAVRISMGLPFIYKPYVIKEEKKGWPPCGTYVDGGLWNNLPFREFDGGSEPDSNQESLAVTNPVSKPHTLGLRLEITPDQSVEDFGAFLKAIANFGVFGSGETQVLSKYVDQTILLDTRGLDLIDFNPPEKDRNRAIKRARRQTWRYFSNAPVPEEDRDDEDDKESEYLKGKNHACS